MKQSHILRHWVKALRKVFPRLSKPQLFVLGAFSLGLAWSGKCTLTKIAQQLWFLARLGGLEGVSWRKCLEIKETIG